MFTLSRANDAGVMRGQARAQQAMAAPRAVSQNLEAVAAIDTRPVLPQVSAGPVAAHGRTHTGRPMAGAARRRVRRAGPLASILFTDIVEATRLANELGNGRWRERLDAHEGLVRQQANLHGGVLVDSAGDGSFMHFALPAEAIDCAQSLHETLQAVQLDIRAGVHRGDVALRDEEDSR